MVGYKWQPAMPVTLDIKRTSNECSKRLIACNVCHTNLGISKGNRRWWQRCSTCQMKNTLNHSNWHDRYWGYLMLCSVCGYNSIAFLNSYIPEWAAVVCRHSFVLALVLCILISDKFNTNALVNYAVLSLAEGTVPPEIGKIRSLRIAFHSASQNWFILKEVWVV